MNGGTVEHCGPSIHSPALALLLTLLRWPADPEAVASHFRVTTAIDWPLFLALVHRHRVISLTAATISNAEAAGVELGAEGVAAAEALRRRARAQSRSGLTQIAEATKLTRLLAPAGVACLQLKGAPLSVRAFGRPLLRDGRDIDMLIESRQLPRADAVLASAGYRRLKPDPGFGRRSQAFYLRYSHEYVFAAPSGVVVELKTRLHPTAGLQPAPVSDVLRRATMVDVAGARLATLGDADMMVYLCAHAARHCWFRLKWLADLGALFAGAGPEWARGLMADCDRLGLPVPALEALKVAHDWLHIEVPEELLARARRDPRVTRRQSTIWQAMTELGPNGDPFAIPGFARQLAHAEQGLRSDLAYRCSVFERRKMVALYSMARALRANKISPEDNSRAF